MSNSSTIARNIILLFTTLFLLSSCMTTYYGVKWWEDSHGGNPTPSASHPINKAAEEKNTDQGQEGRGQAAGENHRLPTLIYAQDARGPTSNAQQASLVFAQQASIPLPESVLLEDVPIGKQTRNLNCEFQTASDLTAYYGKGLGWKDIFLQVGHNPGGNPHKGFVGESLDDPPGGIYPQGYGVYAEPIAQALNKFGLPAEVHYRESAIWLKEQIAQGNPVMVWATAGMRKSHVVEWVSTDGERIKGVPWEHTYLVVGYNKQGVWVGDPWTGKRLFYSWEVFLDSWDLFDRMSVVIHMEKGY